MKLLMNICFNFVLFNVLWVFSENIQRIILHILYVKYNYKCVCVCVCVCVCMCHCVLVCLFVCLERAHTLPTSGLVPRALLCLI